MPTFKSKAEERRRAGKLLDPVACGLERDVQIMQARRQVVEAAMAWHRAGYTTHGELWNAHQAACAALAKLEKE